MNKMAAYELLLDDHPLWSKEASLKNPAILSDPVARSKRVAELRQKFSKRRPLTDSRMKALMEMKMKGKGSKRFSTGTQFPKKKMLNRKPVTE